jgi:hypothetical protein
LFVDELMNRLHQLELVDLNLGPIGVDGIPTIDCIRRGQGPFDVEGTLLIAIRAVCSIEGITDWDTYTGGRVNDRHEGVIIMGGMAFIEGATAGHDLEGRDPTRVVEQTCLLLAGKDFDRDTPDLEAWRIRAEEDYRARKEKQREQDERRARALAKARAILTNYLDEKQLAEFEASGEFHVLGADGFTYLVTSKGHHNVFRIEDGVQTYMYCIVSKGFIPDHDLMLSQMFLLQASPEMFHKTTNTWKKGEDGNWKFVKVEREPGHEEYNPFVLDDIEEPVREPEVLALD